MTTSTKDGITILTTDAEFEKIYKPQGYKEVVRGGGKIAPKPRARLNETEI